MRRASILVATFAVGCLVLASCSSGKGSGQLLTRGGPAPAGEGETVSADAPPTPPADPEPAPDNDPTPVLVRPRATGGGQVSRGGRRPAADAPRAARPTPPRAVPFPELAPPGSLPKAWAVVIGVGDYQGRTHNTVGGAGDAAAFRQALDRAGWPANHILQLVDGAATAANIRQAMQWLVQHSAPDTFTLFHFSGHVCMRGTGGCPQNNHMYLWSVENNFISDDELGGVLRGLQGNAWVDISGCEADAFDKGISSPQRLFTASSTATEKSYEHPHWNQSVWTGLSIDQAMLAGQGDSNGDKRVTVREAINWAVPRAVETTKDQRKGPQHPQVRGADGRDFDLFELAKMPTPPPQQQPPPQPQPQPGGGGGQPSPACTPLTKPIIKC